MKIISRASIGDGDEIFTVQLAPNTFVDVKHCKYEDLYYVMQCEDGWEVFNQNGFTIPEYEFNESMVLNLVRQYAPKKRVLQVSLDILVGPECDGTELAETVEQELNRRGFSVLGASFVDNMTETYMEQYLELLTKEV